MSDQLSILGAMAMKQAKQKFTPKNAKIGWGRGASGSMGAKFFKGRNSHAGEQKELDNLNSPVMKAFMQQLTPRTPITNSLKGI